MQNSTIPVTRRKINSILAETRTLLQKPAFMERGQAAVFWGSVINDQVPNRAEQFIKLIKASKQRWVCGEPPLHQHAHTWFPLFWLIFPLLIHIHNRHVFFRTCSLHL